MVFNFICCGKREREKKPIKLFLHAEEAKSRNEKNIKKQEIHKKFLKK